MQFEMGHIKLRMALDACVGHATALETSTKMIIEWSELCYQGKGDILA
jgi:hypothetical protein